MSVNFAQKSVLVTGGAGFVPSHLVDTLIAAEAEVSVLDNLQAGKWSNLSRHQDHIQLFEGDIRNYDTLQKLFTTIQPDYVFHLAANANVPNSVSDPRYDFEANCVGTFAMLETIRCFSPRTRCVIASSAAVYGTPEYLPIDETSALKPISPYGASKLNAEITARMFKDTFGLDVVIARLFNTYGPRMPRYVVIDFLHKLEKRADHLEILGNGQQVRDLNYVSDTVNGILTIAQHGVAGESYNVGSGASCSVTDLAHLLLDLLNLPNTTISYTGESWSGDVPRFEADITRLRGLGYEPRVDLRTGIGHVIDWFKSTRSH